MSIIGKCPYCENGIIKLDKKDVRGRSTKIYTCSNASWYSEDGEMFELHQKATCSFRIWGNSLQRWGKKGLGYIEVKNLLAKKDVIVKLYSISSKKEYYKYILLNKEFGITILWDVDVDNTMTA